MQVRPIVSLFLTLSGVLVSNAAKGKARCEADLARVKRDFCLSGDHAGLNPPLNYQWKLNDERFDLSTPVCLSQKGADGTPDLILAVDRSQTIWGIDSSRRKLGADNLAAVRRILESLKHDGGYDPQTAPKLGLILFSTGDKCSLYAGDDIIFDREFPCIYIPAESLANPEHVARLEALINSAEGQYSQNLSSASDFRLVTSLVGTNDMGLAQSARKALLLFSDGRSFLGPNGDPYAYLRAGNYLSAQNMQIAAFAKLANYQTVIGLDPLPSPLFGEVHAGGFDNMCADPKSLADCDKQQVKSADPSTWPVNHIDVPGYAAALVKAAGGVAEDLVTLSSLNDTDKLLARIRTGKQIPLKIESATVSVNSAAPTPIEVLNNRIAARSLPAGEKLALELVVSGSGATAKVPVVLTTQLDSDSKKPLADQEMLCESDNVAPATEGPKLKLKNLQGGSASCGVSGREQSGESLLLVLFLCPLLLALRPVKVKSLTIIAVVLGFLVRSNPAFAEGSQGLNALQYRPVIGGVGNTEAAPTLNPGRYNVGLFMSYANDPVELGDDSNKRVSSVMDNLVTAHLVANVGLLDRVSAGVHLPYVHNSDEDRSIEGGERHNGGQLGRPGDAEAMVKIAILRRSGFNLSVMPMMTIPSGDPSVLTGDGTANFGALFLLSGAKGALSWAFDLGYLHRSKALELSDDRAQSLKVSGQVLSYGGVEYSLNSRIAVAGSLQAKVATGSSSDVSASSPAEWSAMAKFKPFAALETEGGVGSGLGKGYGAPDYRVFAGVSFVPDEAQQRARTIGSVQTSAAAKK